MSKMSISPEFEKLKQEYENLKVQVSTVIEEREHLIYHQAVSIQTEYIDKIGGLEYELFEIECKHSRTKRMIEMVQANINNQKKFDLSELDDQLDKEFREYMDNLNKMAAEIKKANYIKDCETLTEIEAKEVKSIYRELVKLLHPDLNPEISDEQKILWKRVSEAYQTNNIEMLRILQSILVDSIPFEVEDKNATEILKEKIENLQKKLVELFADIEKVKKVFPFNVTELLASTELIEERRNELNASIKTYKHMHEELVEILMNMMSEVKQKEKGV